ncbi:MAG: alpha/beta-type small acid-soluble spore protein [Clostridia bacterium]
MSNSNNSNNKVVPEATEALNKFKYEVASEVGVTLKDGYNGNISARDAGRIGGNMVRKLIQQAESQMK